MKTFTLTVTSYTTNFCSGTGTVSTLSVTVGTCIIFNSLATIFQTPTLTTSSASPPIPLLSAVQTFSTSLYQSLADCTSQVNLLSQFNYPISSSVKTSCLPGILYQDPGILDFFYTTHNSSSIECSSASAFTYYTYPEASCKANIGSGVGRSTNCAAQEYANSHLVTYYSTACNLGVPTAAPTYFYCQPGTELVAGSCTPSFALPNACNCTTCAQGTFGTGHLAKCEPCPAGTYTDPYYLGIGAPSCTLCEVNTYSTTIGAISSNTCVACPSGRIGQLAGAPSSDYCINPTTNFAGGFVAAFFASILAVVYVIYGRFTRVAFLRREVSKAVFK